MSEPLSDYSRFGVWLSQFVNAAGDDVRYLARDRAESADLPRHDYWLFDSRKLIIMHFGQADEFLGGEAVVEPSRVVQHNYWRDAALHHAVQRREFVRE